MMQYTYKVFVSETRDLYNINRPGRWTYEILEIDRATGIARHYYTERGTRITVSHRQRGQTWPTEEAARIAADKHLHHLEEQPQN